MTFPYSHAANTPETSAPSRNDCPVGISSPSHCVNAQPTRTEITNWNQIMAPTMAQNGSR